ncbi:hypothetical protein H0X48_04945 [Candidatus Dependentiae bacterium]|nr:hypothetical protein [Candidatus Dependentiae bacterium]
MKKLILTFLLLPLSVVAMIDKRYLASRVRISVELRNTVEAGDVQGVQQLLLLLKPTAEDIHTFNKLAHDKYTQTHRDVYKKVGQALRDYYIRTFYNKP